MSSPLIIERGTSPDGVLRVKGAIAEYCKIGRAAQPPPRVELIETYRGVGMICLLYRNVTRAADTSWLLYDSCMDRHLVHTTNATEHRCRGRLRYRWP